MSHLNRSRYPRPFLILAAESATHRPINWRVRKLDATTGRHRGALYADTRSCANGDLKRAELIRTCQRTCPIRYVSQY